jgi:hypothetical protein
MRTHHGLLWWNVVWKRVPDGVPATPVITRVQMLQYVTIPAAGGVPTLITRTP